MSSPSKTGYTTKTALLEITSRITQPLTTIRTYDRETDTLTIDINSMKRDMAPYMWLMVNGQAETAIKLAEITGDHAYHLSNIYNDIQNINTIAAEFAKAYFKIMDNEFANDWVNTDTFHVKIGRLDATVKLEVIDRTE